MTGVHAVVAILVNAALLSGISGGARAEGNSALERDFQRPPPSAAPRVWWHWMNGNISEQGITQDLEWMHRVGIRGVQVFDASEDTPKVVDKRLAFMTPLWKKAFKHAAELADRFGLELAVAGAPGWSESGGPWVRPEEAMKKLVWSETRMSGGLPFSGTLPMPPDTIGPFQNVPADRTASGFSGPTPIKPVPNLYRDVAVIAYRLPDQEQSMSELNPSVTSSAGPISGSALWDGDFVNAIHLPLGKQGVPAWIQLDFGRLQSVQSMSLGLQNFESAAGPRYIGAELDSSMDGVRFTPITSIYDTADDSLQGMAPSEETVTFAPTTARYFRLLLLNPPHAPVPPGMEGFLGPAPTEHLITEFQLYSTPRVDHFEKKAGFFLDAGRELHPTRHLLGKDVIRPEDVADVTPKLRPDGTFEWVPPRGRWAVLRIGYSLLGTTNGPASPEGTGLEVDKLSRTAVITYMENYLDRYRSLLGTRLIGNRGLRGLVNDSYEAGPQNWTDELPAAFARRRGYDLHVWLPALTGRVIGSAEATDRFLWDFRRTLGELLADNHYHQITSSLHSRGMIHYGESHEVSRAFIGDGMAVKSSDDIPMGAMWVPGFPLIPQEKGDADIRESASVAHIYGQNLVAAESMTVFGTKDTAYTFAPESLKPTADRELANGLNLFVIHTSVHQPRADLGPGVTLGPFGQWFSRHETWGDDAAPWIAYLARSSYLLQRGRFVADVIYYYGQDSNITALYGEHLPPVPKGYSFDFANDDALNVLSVRDGDLVTASGMRYRLLVLDPRARIVSLDVLKTIAKLVAEGATVVSERPEATPSLADNPAEFSALVGELWADGAPGVHGYGAGRVFIGMSMSQAIATMQIPPDFSYSKAGVRDDAPVWFVHRRSATEDIYFINNRSDTAEQITARFRVSGKSPELWHADSGVIESVSYRQEDGETVIPLRLDTRDAVFVVFRKSTQKRERIVPELLRKPLSTLEGPWDVRFQPGRGSSERATFTELTSWSTNAATDIKYFSGTASYMTQLKAASQWFDRGGRVEIDLGVVKDLAEIFVNGKSAGIVWKAPFRADITAFLRPGANRLTVRVTNLWPNRLIGDRQPNADRVAFTTFNPYSADSPLLESGLLGPVVISRATRSMPSAE